MEGCCVLVFIIVLLVIVLAFGTVALSIIVLILCAVYPVGAQIVFGFRRIIWARKIRGFSDAELNAELTEVKETLVLYEKEAGSLEKVRIKLAIRQGRGDKTANWASVTNHFETEKTNARIVDAKARIKTLTNLLKEPNEEVNNSFLH